jgi:hypothetical protein
MILQHTQTGQDGIGQKKVLSGLYSVRLKAKKVLSVKNTTLKIEGESSGASWTIGVVVNSGDTVLEYYPPPVNPNPPSGPVAAFSWVLDELQA